MSSKVTGLAGARKMAKKGGSGTLQIEVNSDEDWSLLLEKKGLVVVDVYTEWCGPCVAMMSNLKRIKLEFGGENLHLALANANAVTALERFRGKSEPTWIFIGSGQLVRVFFGSNAPKLAKLILSELEKEVKCMNEEMPRLSVAWGEMTEDEKLKNSETFAKREMAKERLRLEEEMIKDRVKRRNLERLARFLVNQTVVVFFPHSIVEPSEDAATHKRACQAAYRLMVRYDPVGLQIVDQLDFTLRKEDVVKMLYNSSVSFPDEMLDTIHLRPCIISLIQEYGALGIGEKPTSMHSFGDVNKSFTSSLDLIEDKMAGLVYGESKDPHNPKDDSVVKIYEGEIHGVKVPPCWTPLEHISKSAAMQVLFPSKVAALEVVEEKVPPPSYIIIFEATRAHEVLEVAEPFADDVVHVAFFTSDNMDTAEKICHSVYDLEKKGKEVVADAKMVIALQKSRSDPMLTLATLGPLYISPDLRTGTMEMERWFPPTIDLVEEPDPWAPPPPPPPKYWMDDDQNVYIEEYRRSEDGEQKKGRRLYRLADGTLVEDGEWTEIPEEEPKLPPVVKPKKKKKDRSPGRSPGRSPDFDDEVDGEGEEAEKEPSGFFVPEEDLKAPQGNVISEMDFGSSMNLSEEAAK